MMFKRVGSVLVSVVSSVVGVMFFSSSAFAFTDDVPFFVNEVAENTKIFTDLEQRFRFDGHKSVKRGEFLEWIIDNKNPAIDTDMYANKNISQIFIDVTKNNNVSVDEINYISAGYALNVLTQFEEKGKFLKNKKLTRIEAVRMLFALENISVVQRTGPDMQNFWGDLPESAKDKNLILVAIEKGFLRNKSGLTDKISTVEPYNYLTRNDAVWMLYVLNNQEVQEKTSSVNSERGEHYENLEKVEALLNTEYLRQDNITTEELQDAAINGMVESLNDPYTVYLPPEASEAFTNYINEEPEVEKEYAGLGVAIQPATNGGLVITEIFDGSPAQVAKMQVGDVITGVDGVDMIDLSVSEIVSKIKGEVGTSSVLMIQRNNKKLEIRFIRKKIFIEGLSTVNYEVKDRILWIKIRSFKSFTSRDFTKILNEELGENSNIRGVIVDLRFNPGGLMNVAQEMLGEVLPDGSIAVRLYNSNNTEDIYYVDGSGNYTDIPLVVFQNEYSASASEIFSAAIKDYERGDIIGTTSYGKGVAQQLFTLPRGMLKVTTAEFRSPFQNIIHGIGVKPDHEMKDQSDESYFYEAKLRLK